MVETRSRHHSTGIRLIAFAWGVEILAAAVGLLIATATGYSIRAEIYAFEGRISPSAMTSIALGALPFVMVAIVELTKIPLAVGFYNAPRLRWRVVFGVTLVFLILITFETALNGFERNFSNLTRTIQDQRAEILKLEDETAILDEKISGTGVRDEDQINSRYDQLITDAQNSRRAAIVEIDQMIANRYAVANVGRVPGLQVSLESVRAEISQRTVGFESERASARADYETRRTELREDFARRIDAAREADRTELVGLEERLLGVNEQLQEMFRAEQQEIEGAIFRNAVRDRWAEQRAPLESQREQLNAQISGLRGRQDSAARLATDLDERLRAADTAYQDQSARLDAAYQSEIDGLRARETNLERQLAEAQGQTQDTLGEEVAVLEQQKVDAQEFWNSERLRLEQERSEALAGVEQTQFSVEGLQAEREAVLRSTSDLRAEINDRVADNQVYRITALWTGQDDASLVSRQDLRVTALVWFGSLSIIVALTGTVLAFAGLVLVDERSHLRPSTGPIGRSLRRLLIALRRRINKPRTIEIETIVEKVVEVTKEIPVERVAIQEVPREVVKKVVMHVPLYTNDKSLLGMIDSGSGSEPK